MRVSGSGGAGGGDGIGFRMLERRWGGGTRGVMRGGREQAASDCTAPSVNTAACMRTNDQMQCEEKGIYSENLQCYNGPTSSSNDP